MVVDPPTQTPPRSAPDEERTYWAARNAEYEADRLQDLEDHYALQEAAEEFAAKVPPHMWRWCDGEGGAVYDALREAFADRGLLPYGPSVKAKRRKISPGTRRKVFERNAYRCVTCGSFKDLHVDHIVALTNGGTDDLDNLQTLCAVCNMRKGAS